MEKLVGIQFIRNGDAFVNPLLNKLTARWKQTPISYC